MSESFGEFTVVSWNILYDTGRMGQVTPQAERYQDCAESLIALSRPVDKNLDIVALYEVEDSLTLGNLGEKIAELTSNQLGFWTPHSREREHVGMFGKEVDEVEFIELNGDKTAVITQLGSVSVAGVHLTFDLRGSSRRGKQIQVILDRLKDAKQAVIMGDFNSLPWQKPRKIIETNGFRSVFNALGQKQPPTAPTSEYRPMLKKWQRFAIGKGLSTDDIYIKGLDVMAAGVFEGKSDHLGVWATLRP